MNNNMSYETEDITASDRILHTPSDFARKNFLYIQEAGKLKSLKPHVSSRSDLDSYLIFAVLKGSGTVKTNGTVYHISEGDCAFINCMEPYEHISDEDNPWELAWVHFNGNNAGSYYQLFLQNNEEVSYFHMCDGGSYTDIVDKIMESQNEKDQLSEVNTSLYLTELVTMVIRDVVKMKEHKGEHNLSKLREQINERFREENLFEKLCQENNMDEMSLNKEYKDKYGIDLCDYILNRRFTCAKELLRFTVKPVKEIVTESGIGNADLFRNLFNKNEGMTAEEYREKWSQWNRG